MSISILTAPPAATRLHHTRRTALGLAVLAASGLGSAPARAADLTVNALGQDTTVTASEIRVNGVPAVPYAGATSVEITDAANLVVLGDDRANALTLSATGTANTAVFTLDQGPPVSIAAQSFRFDGAAGRDLFRVDDSQGALPRFTGRAVGAHSNPAFDASGLSPAEPNIGIHFQGDGDDDLALASTDATGVSYFADTAGVAKSGIVNVNGVLNLSFEGIAPLAIIGAGGSLLVDATTIPLTNLVIDDDLFAPPLLAIPAAAGNGVSAIYDPNGGASFETVQFSGFNEVTLRGGPGAQTIDLVAIDDVGGVLTDVILDGDDTFNADAGDDLLRVQTLPAGVTATLMGGADSGVAGDTYALTNLIPRPRAGEVPGTVVPINTVDGILGPVVVQPASSPGVFMSPEEGGVETLRVIDSGDPTGDAVTTTATTIDGITGFAGSPDIGFNSADPVDDLLIDTSNTGDDVVDVDQLAMTEITTDGGGHITGDTLLVDTQGITATDDGAVVFTPGLRDVNYANFETVDPCVSTDADGDGVCDADDACPASDLSPTVVIDGCDSGAGNDVGADGCTINDQITELAASAGTDRLFNRAVHRLVRNLYRSGGITRPEKSDILSCL